MEWFSQVQSLLGLGPSGHGEASNDPASGSGKKDKKKKDKRGTDSTYESGAATTAPILIGGEWQCSVCTLVNEAHATSCGACGAERGGAGPSYDGGGGGAPTHEFHPPTAGDTFDSRDELPLPQGLPPQHTVGSGGSDLPHSGDLLPPQHTMPDMGSGHSGGHGYNPTLPPDHFDGREHGRHSSKRQEAKHSRDRDSGSSSYFGMQQQATQRSSNTSSLPRPRKDQGRFDYSGSSSPALAPAAQRHAQSRHSRGSEESPKGSNTDVSMMSVDDVLGVHAQQVDGGVRGLRSMPVAEPERRSREHDSLGSTQRASRQAASAARAGGGSSIGQRMHSGAPGAPIAGGRLRLRILRAFNLRNTDLGVREGDVSDPFVVARLGRQEFKTEVVENNLNPVWNSSQFEFAISDDADRLELEVFNANQWHADSLGRLAVTIGNLTPGETHCVREELDEGEGVVRDDGLSPLLEVEMTFLSPEEVAAGRMGATGVQAGAAQQLAKAQEHRAPNWVPLPSFQGLGPEAYERPSRNPLEEINAVAVQRRMLGYESMACRMGQYDYSSDPTYYPNQDIVDKRRWKDDPFYGWRQELQKTEHNLAPRRHDGRQEDDERNDEEDVQIWARDPFHGWLADSAGEQGGEERSRLEQEARIARQLVSLPSFHDADTKRFDDHRDYADAHKVERRGRMPGADLRPAYAAGPQQTWRDDAFFGWLPGRGPDGEDKHQLHRPLEQARLKRLPSFSEQATMGITGHGIGLLRIWVNGAFGLRYDEMSGLRGRPSACVRVCVGGTEKLTATSSADSNPRWNSPAMTFEVASRTDKLTMEVWDMVSNHRHFLGRLELRVSDEIISVMEGGSSYSRHDSDDYDDRGHRDHRQGKSQRHDRHDRQHGSPGQEHRPRSFRRQLEGLRHHAELDFSCLFEPFDTEVSHSRVGRPKPQRPKQQQRLSDAGHRPDHGSGRHRDHPPRTMSMHSNASSGADQIGVLSVRVIAAYDLVNTDTGIMGDVSDPYVTLKLRSQGDRLKPKRTQTVDNNLNPKWNTSAFLFPLMQEDDELLLEVFDEDMLTSDDFLGRLTVPLYRIVRGQPGVPVRIKDRLMDIEHGELEVEIGFSQD